MTYKFTTERGEPGPASVEMGYIFLDDDILYDPVVYQSMADRLPEDSKSTISPGPHEAMLTHPNELAAAILTLSGGTR